MEGYPVSTRIHVRWRDLDAMGHVNNAVYLTYLEIARISYFEEVFAAVGPEQISFIVASVRCDFRSAVRYGEIVDVGIRIPSVGRTSFDFEYEARVIGDGRLVALARSTQVLYDYQEAQKLPITESWLERVVSAQGGLPEQLTQPRV